MGYKNDDPCIKKAYPDERLFVLMARDPAAPKVILHWIAKSIGVQPPDKIQEALECALEMDSKGVEFRERKGIDDKKQIELRERDEFEHWKKHRKVNAMSPCIKEHSQLSKFDRGLINGRMESNAASDKELNLIRDNPPFTPQFIRDDVDRSLIKARMVDLERMIANNVCEEDETFGKTDAVNLKRYITEYRQLKNEIAQ